jgi:muramoyltetrapeptide carboxypeptidase
VALKLGSAEAFIAYVQQLLGPNYLVTADVALLEAHEDAMRGGRTDDEARAADLQDAFADPTTAAIVAVRGGAWFARTLRRIDFSVLERRPTRLALFGFSEITPLINIVAASRGAVGVYDMGPAFLTYGLRHFVLTRGQDQVAPGQTPEHWVEARLLGDCAAYFRQVVDLIESRGEGVTLTTQRVAGRLPDCFEATFVGGNLTVLSTLVGSKFEPTINPDGRWILLEDFNDKPERFDRFLTHFTLAGYWDRCEGILLGDFHNAHVDLGAAMLEMLRFHLPADRAVPILHSKQVGHTWPMTPVPFHIPGSARRSGNQFNIHWSASKFQTT